jgi:hypothetical protein
MEEVLGIVRSSLTAPPPASSPIAAPGAELALPAQRPLEIVDETPATALDDMDLDAWLWEQNTNEDEDVYTGVGEGVVIDSEGNRDVENE